MCVAPPADLSPPRPSDDGLDGSVNEGSREFEMGKMSHGRVF